MCVFVMLSCWHQTLICVCVCNVVVLAPEVDLCVFVMLSCASTGVAVAAALRSAYGERGTTYIYLQAGRPR